MHSQGLHIPSNLWTAQSFLWEPVRKRKRNEWKYIVFPHWLQWKKISEDTGVLMKGLNTALSLINDNIVGTKNHSIRVYIGLNSPFDALEIQGWNRALHTEIKVGIDIYLTLLTKHCSFQNELHYQKFINTWYMQSPIPLTGLIFLSNMVNFIFVWSVFLVSSYFLSPFFIFTPDLGWEASVLNFEIDINQI